MNSIVCTLFEGHYHYGVAALTNSLYTHGYRGAIYAGYKGVVPPWATGAKIGLLPEWNGSCTYQVSEDLQIHFLPMQSDYHLANCKPDFMLRLLNDVVPEAGGVIYFDPDIVNKCRWDFYNQWMDCGVALVYEVVSNPMPATHPIRLGWEKVLEKCGRKTIRKLHHSFNSGFCGASRKHVDFLELWAEVIDVAIQNYGLDPKKFVTSSDRTQYFSSSDQDALNIAAMGSNSPISELGPDGMDFIPGGWVMSHATGAGKPWKKKFVLSALKGIGPTRAEKAYWSYADGPIAIYPSNQIRLKHLSLLVASFLSRFYQRR